jgi:hypothetical protein
MIRERKRELERQLDNVDERIRANEIEANDLEAEKQDYMDELERLDPEESESG